MGIMGCFQFSDYNHGNRNSGFSFAGDRDYGINGQLSR